MTPEPLIKPLVAEYRANPRLRLGVWAIVGIVWLYGVLELRDAVASQREAYRAVNRGIARAEVIASQPEWTARLDEARSAQLDLESRLWRESTVGLAQATFHDWLGQVVQQSGLSRPLVTVAAQEEGPRQADEASGLPGLWKISARLAFEFGPASLNAFLARTAGHEKHVVVESLVIRSTPTPRAEAVLVAYFRKPSTGSAPDSDSTGRQRR